MNICSTFRYHIRVLGSPKYGYDPWRKDRKIFGCLATTQIFCYSGVVTEGWQSIQSIETRARKAIENWQIVSSLFLEGMPAILDFRNLLHGVSSTDSNLCNIFCPSSVQLVMYCIPSHHLNLPVSLLFRTVPNSVLHSKFLFCTRCLKKLSSCPFTTSSGHL